MNQLIDIFIIWTRDFFQIPLGFFILFIISFAFALFFAFAMINNKEDLLRYHNEAEYHNRGKADQEEMHATSLAYMIYKILFRVFIGIALIPLVVQLIRSFPTHLF